MYGSGEQELLDRWFFGPTVSCFGTWIWWGRMSWGLILICNLFVRRDEGHWVARFLTSWRVIDVWVCGTEFSFPWEVSGDSFDAGLHWRVRETVPFPLTNGSSKRSLLNRCQKTSEAGYASQLVDSMEAVQAWADTQNEKTSACKSELHGLFVRLQAMYRKNSMLATPFHPSNTPCLA